LGTACIQFQARQKETEKMSKCSGGKDRIRIPARGSVSLSATKWGRGGARGAAGEASDPYSKTK
jgi:hypothetical protein